MWFYPKIVAHRGGGTLAPENTLAAMRCGLQHGFHAVEFDVMLSADRIPVLMHDPQFGRTVRGAGNVADTTAASLAAMDAGAWHGPSFAGEPVPRYEDVVAFCKENRIWMNVEIKPAPLHEVETGQVVGELTRQLFQKEAQSHIRGTNDVSLPLFSSFSFEALMAAKEAAPEIPRGFLLDKLAPGWLDKAQALDVVAIHTNHKNLSPDQVAMVKEHGYGLFCYTVNTPERAREILGWGVDAFCTDRIDLIGPEFG
ncbi:glycerophosphodiester phosphodiesterase [Noviherbaspirillum galbum]|uniref:Glycerophosphodiester phosphodiesterase n=1 Tax=Noviherbaspirillum galbum TaxID=2709383 RepID=A0A6B3SI35_9BURK|nr:glycerophosphodiester phosphodiesterase [Noviherbaspirillum galbum]NEX60507.1 glycerophosphodiester phosphodiesterase [Noviherbaspirillum galbum]